MSGAWEVLADTCTLGRSLMCLFLLEGSPTLLPASSPSSSFLFLLPTTRSSPSAAPMLPTTPTTTPPPLAPTLLALTVATWGATLAKLVVGTLVTVARVAVSADTSPHTTGGVATDRTGVGVVAGGGADAAGVLVVVVVDVEGWRGVVMAGGGTAGDTTALLLLEVSSTAGELTVESIRGGAATPTPAPLASTVGETLAVTTAAPTLPDWTAAVATKDGGRSPRLLLLLLALCEEISEPCTLLDSATRGEVERAKGTGTEVVALAGAPPPPEVEAIKC